VEQAE